MASRGVIVGFAMLGLLIGCAHVGTTHGGLAGTHWRLVNIASMDGAGDPPSDPDRYILALDTDGKFTLRSDCNLGNGTWSSTSANQILFGPVAATNALCPPPSRSEAYLGHFRWIRSYSMKDGHLFLATMADGAILEFEPLPPVVAHALGEEIRANDASEMRDAILGRLFDRYAQAQGITVSDAELDAFVDGLRRGTAASGGATGQELTSAEQRNVDDLRRQMGRGLILQWKVNKSLYQTYGGRLGYQQFGPEPLDARRLYLKDRQAAGDFTIDDKTMSDEFWQYFSDDSKHDFMKPDAEAATRAFSNPPWEQKTAP